jgi:predicted dehydrogenase
MIGIALLGAGYAADIQLAGWKRVPDAQVVGVWNRTPERARALAARHGVPHADDLDVLLASPEVTAVDVATAVETHRDYALRAAADGKHVLCQKPMAPSYREAEELVEGCEAAGVRLMVNENWRWRPWYRTARTVLDRGNLGHPFYLRLAFRSASAVATPERPPGRLFERQPFLRSMRPLILLELGPHHLDIARYLFGQPRELYARTLKVTPADHVAGEEVATVLLTAPDRIAQVELSWASLGYPQDAVNKDLLSIEGTEGSLFIGHDGQVRTSLRDGREEVIEVDTADAYQRSWTAALAHFTDCLMRDRPFETSGRDNLETLRLVFGAYESAAAGRPVPVS